MKITLTLFMMILAGYILLAAPWFRPRANPAAFAAEADCTAYYSDIIEAMSSSGAGAGAIPALTNPAFIAARLAELSDDDVVLGLVYKGFTAAYPRRIMSRHEVVNQTVAGDRIAVTFCPLTGSAIVFVGDFFNVSGLLYNSNQVLYNQADNMRLPQMLGQYVEGPRCATGPKTLPIVTTTWKLWRNLHPETMVLSQNTGYLRDYYHDPYSSYYHRPGILFPVMHKASDELHPKDIVFCIQKGQEKAAVVKSGFSERHPLGMKIKFRDSEVFLQWDPELEAIRAPEQFTSFEAFWFAWYAYYPESRIFR